MTKAGGIQVALKISHGVVEIGFENLLDRQCTAEEQNQRRIATSPTSGPRKRGRLYAAGIDLFSRRVVGWSMSDTMTAQLAANALMMAIWRRGKLDALPHRSDHGSISLNITGKRWLNDRLTS